jgi:hypothetical protein
LRPRSRRITDETIAPNDAGVESLFALPGLDDGRRGERSGLMDAMPLVSWKERIGKELGRDYRSAANSGPEIASKGNAIHERMSGP